jgi:S-adenosylmethionine synthetase
MRSIKVDFLDVLPLEDQPIELVERKGVGHPDSICDGVVEAVSRGLSKHYLEKFGAVLHHNTDKCLLIGGKSEWKFGGGVIIKPQHLILGGRATAFFDKQKIPIDEIALNSARDYLKENFSEIQPDKNFTLEERIGEGSVDLKSVFMRTGMPKSNDTSFGVGYAPLSTLERLTIDASNHLNFTSKIKAAGKDTKVMGVRKEKKIILTVACAMVSKYVKDIGEYIKIKGQIKKELTGVLSKKTDMDVQVEVNTADDIPNGEVYLTVTGLSSEQGDDGSVGRGNRCNGVIAPFRPVSLEAVAGKNPVNHVGKIYNLLADKIAAEIAQAGAKQVYVRLMSQIGKPIDQPLVASLQLIGDRKLENKARQIADYWLEHVTDVTEWCLDCKVNVF